MTYTYTQDDFNGIEVKDSDGLVVAVISSCTPEFLAGAIAAPELVEALQNLTEIAEMNAPHIIRKADIKKAKAAILKAEATQ